METLMELPVNRKTLTLKEIQEILPHRFPFLFVDKVIDIDLSVPSIIGQKNVSANEPFFEGHWPGAPIMPGVIILEALAQAGGILVYEKGYTDKTAVLLNISNAKFRNPVYPGDILYLHVTGEHFSNIGGRVKAKAIVNDKPAVEAEIAFAFRAKSQIGS